MKDLAFLKHSLITNKGIYDNERLFENTLQAYARAMKHGYGIYLSVYMLEDGTIVCFEDDNLSRMLHVEQKIEKVTYDDLSYMAKYQIPTLEEVLEVVRGVVPVYIKINTKTRKFLLEKKISEILDSYNGKFTVESDSLRVIKWFLKNKNSYIVGYNVNKENYRTSFLFKKYDYINLDYRLFKDKAIRKIRESRIVIGHLIENKNDYLIENDVCDNLIVDNILEIIK